MTRYLTTPIYYVNDKPHVGHAYCTVLVDAAARWSRLLGHPTFFLTGTDEHGQKVQRAAEKRGVTPQQHCDELHLAFKSLWPALHVEPGDFIRTTEPRHKRVVQGALQTLYDRGLIYSKPFQGWYCVSEERFWTEKDLVDGKCPTEGNTVEWIEEKNWFFRMSRYQQALIDHIHSNPDFIRPESRKNEVLGFLRQPLEDLCISRPKSRLSWGIELPFDTDYVTYVWFDALLNYLTGIGYPDAPGWQEWWQGAIHVVGKDILTTHSVYWTTMLMALGVPLPRGIVAHGWWLWGGDKMSKSVGNVVSPLEQKDKYGVEVFRYYLLREMAVGQDANFSEESLVTRNNTELANDLGNLISRSLNLVEKRFDSKVPAYSKADPTQDDDVRALISRLPGAVGAAVDDFRTHAAVEACMALVRRLNKYLTDTAPFTVVKTDPERAASILRVVMDGLAAVGYWLGPAMPEKMADLERRLGASGGVVHTGSVTARGDSLFPRFEPPAAVPDAAPAAAAAAPEPPVSTGKATIAFEDFAKIDLRVAQIVTAERVPGSDKLLRLTVDLGTETRQVVAGIATRYGPEEMVGRRVVVVANLAPRKIFGLESRGMILAARDGTGLFVLSPDGFANAGAEVS